MSDTIRMMALSGLAYESEAPLGWKSVDRFPDGPELHKLHVRNAQLLIADASLEEHHRRIDPKDESQPFYQELQRLEFKLDIVLRLIGDLLEQREVLPPRRKFRIHAQGLEWIETETKLATKARGIVCLYLNKTLPYPVELPCEIVAVLPATAEGTPVRGEFRVMNAQVGELIEKLIFRHHRRQVAEARLADKKN